MEDNLKLMKNILVNGRTSIFLKPKFTWLSHVLRSAQNCIIVSTDIKLYTNIVVTILVGKQVVSKVFIEKMTHLREDKQEVDGRTWLN